MAVLTLFTCSEMSSVGVSCTELGNSFEKGTLMSTGEQWSSNDLSVTESYMMSETEATKIERMRKRRFIYTDQDK